MARKQNYELKLIAANRTAARTICLKENEAIVTVVSDPFYVTPTCVSRPVFFCLLLNSFLK